MFDITECTRISDAGLTYHAEAPNLIHVSLNGCPLITDNGILLLSKNLKWESIALTDCPKVTAQGIANFQARLPKTRIRTDDNWKVP